ncbi:hypothetical protein F5Y16DRAFT_102361 [Xylariaceae sp. FL0255]|nr:hypothetical protein F5Y16DRAFT_102361 [Xylariaceae sp. FL0255]
MAPKNEYYSKEEDASVSGEGDEYLEEDDAWSDPGSKIMWFGEHKGTRLDNLDDSYRWWIVGEVNSKHNLTSNFIDFARWNTRYLDWRCERHSPLLIKIWFGQDKGREIRSVYSSGVGRYASKWTWWLKNTDWSFALRDIERRYLEWQEEQTPISRPSRRQFNGFVNPVGQRLTRWDDRAAPDNNEDYEKDSFIATSGDEDIDEDERSDGDEEVSQYEEENGDAENARGISAGLENSGEPSYDSDSSDDSLPPVEKIFFSSKAKRLGPTYHQSAISVSPAKRRRSSPSIVTSDDSGSDKQSSLAESPSK